MIVVDFLKKYPQHVRTVARWIYDEWVHVLDRDFEACVAATRTRLNQDRVPLTLVALRGQECVGTVSLFACDLPGRSDLWPWLAALYVPAGHRSEGVGRKLMEQLESVAVSLGIHKLYLHTETASAYYRRAGWRFLFPAINDRGEPTEVFEKAIADGGAGQ